MSSQSSPSTAAASRATENAPSVSLPFAFVIVGLLALLTGMGWLLARPDLLATYHYNQQVIAVTHLFVLGWITSVVMGSMYQLVPVALETRLHSEKLARWQFVFHVVGFGGMVYFFQAWDLKQVGHFGSVLTAGVALFVYNLARTLRSAPRWSVTATGISSALAWISVAVLVGLSLAAAKCTYEATNHPAGVGSLVSGLRAIAAYVARFDPISAMHGHAHLGVVGCFVMLIVGVSYKLIPMFTLSEVQSRSRAAWSVAFLNAGLAGAFFTILLRSAWKPAFALLISAGLALYALELRAILRARKRRSLDWGIKYFLTAVALLAPLSLLGLVLSWPNFPLTPLTGQLENLYGFLGLIGVVTFAIIGMLYKVIPFLVWFGRYSSQIGRAQVPALADLYSARLQAAGYWAYLAGLLTTSGAIVFSSSVAVRAGVVLLWLGLLTLTINVGFMLSHFIKPRLKPLVLPGRAATHLA